MSTFLIADAGGTSTNWSLCDAEGHVLASRTTAGINAIVSSDDSIMKSLAAASDMFAQSDKIHFYGAGCKGVGIDRLKSYFNHFLQESTELYLYSDMLGAARSLWGNDSGIAAILGTGSNSCLYDGDKIIGNVPPLGFILGDEGSGVNIGKALLKSYLRNELDDGQLKDAIETHINLQGGEPLDRVYNQREANVYLSSFAPIASRFIEVEEVRNLVEEEFHRLFNNCLVKYRQCGIYDLAFIGSIAYSFAEILKRLSNNYGFVIKKIVADPLQGLIDFHVKHNYE